MDIHTQLWPGTFVSDATLVGLVKEVRRALRANQPGMAVRTAHRIGYAFVIPVELDVGCPVPSITTHWLVVGARRIALQTVSASSVEIPPRACGLMCQAFPAGMRKSL